MRCPSASLSLLCLHLLCAAPMCAAEAQQVLAAVPDGLVRGRVQRPDGQPLAGVTLELFESEERTVSDSTGTFRLRTTWSGPALLVARHVGDPPVAVELTLPLDSALVITLPKGVRRLAAFTVQPAGEFRLTASTTAEPLSPLDIVQTPGAAANVARALQVAPGVSNVDEGTGLFVRGGDVTETRVLVDDVVMLSPARFSNPTGHVGATLNPFLLSNATLSAGAFGAAYGNALSGVVRMETAGRPARHSGSLSASIGSVSANTALALSPRVGVRALASISDLAPLVAAFGEAQPYAPAPRGGDAALTMEYATSAHSRVRLFTVRQQQEFGVGRADFTGNASYAATTTEGLTVLSWRDTSSQWRPSISMGRSRFDRDERLTGLDLTTALASDHMVATVKRAPGHRVAVAVGVEYERFTAAYRGTSTDAPNTGFTVRTPTRRTGVHAELVWRVSPNARLTAGVRGDRSDFTRRTTADPRLAFAVQRGHWGLVASAGAYSQIPEPILVRQAVAVPMRVTQATLAIERGDSAGLRVRTEGYVRRWRSLAQFTPSFGIAGNGEGDALGVDSELRYQLGERANTRVVWSVLDARRTDPATGTLAPAPMSITHTVAWLTQREIRRVSLSTALRYATGRPFTDIVGRTMPSAAAVAVQPVFGAPNAARLPGYWRSDLSVSWLLTRQNGPTSVVWASISNVFDRRNVMRYAWDTAYTVRTPVRSPFNRSIYVGATLLLP
ncbi:TonB-dependent receptor domain-containing protein [Gemmatimonas sp.]